MSSRSASISSSSFAPAVPPIRASLSRLARASSTVANNSWVTESCSSRASPDRPDHRPPPTSSRAPGQPRPPSQRSATAAARSRRRRRAFRPPGRAPAGCRRASRTRPAADIPLPATPDQALQRGALADLPCHDWLRSRPPASKSAANPPAPPPHIPAGTSRQPQAGASPVRRRRVLNQNDRAGVQLRRLNHRAGHPVQHPLQRAATGRARRDAGERAIARFHPLRRSGAAVTSVSRSAPASRSPTPASSPPGATIPLGRWMSR